MASRNKTYKMSADLEDGAAILGKRNGYTSGAALIKGLLRYALLCGSSHHVSLKWASLSLPDQDKLDAALLVLAQAGHGMTAAEAATITFEEILARAAVLEKSASKL